ncbi:vesicle transport through interaction with t-SNAREs homolog 1B isoform X2 [Pongo abelii]|uniref:Vesicle transport through interaction with t-SNAREs 1B n=2 Tax=Pongo abelii TaxID=9601 RepID=H2NLK7_PONAB|nr:vesicle transport through interaction with t-SNAREs homolog 1B isoform X2 [Pongo abelii]
MQTYIKSGRSPLSPRGLNLAPGATRDPGTRRSRPSQTTSPGVHCNARPPPAGGAREEGGRAARPAGALGPFAAAFPHPGPGTSWVLRLPLAPAPQRSLRSRLGCAVSRLLVRLSRRRSSNHWLEKVGVPAREDPAAAPEEPCPGRRWCGGRRYGHWAGRLTAGLGEGPGPRISVAAARARPAPWPPPPPPRSISRSCTRSSAASMKTYKECPSGCWGRRGPLAEMEEELRYAPLSFRNPMMSKLRNYRKDLAKLHREVRSTPLTATPGGRGDMKYGIYAVENEHMNRLQSQRAMLLQGTESLNRATQSIERSHRIATETDQIGSEIIEELGEQRDQLERTKSRSDNQQAAAFHYHLTGARHPGRPGLLQILSQPLNFYREGFVDQYFDLVNA